VKNILLREAIAVAAIINPRLKKEIAKLKQKALIKFAIFILKYLFINITNANLLIKLF